MFKLAVLCSSINSSQALHTDNSHYNRVHGPNDEFFSLHMTRGASELKPVISIRFGLDGVLTRHSFDRIIHSQIAGHGLEIWLQTKNPKLEAKSENDPRKIFALLDRQNFPILELRNHGMPGKGSKGGGKGGKGGKSKGPPSLGPVQFKKVRRPCPRAVQTS